MQYGYKMSKLAVRGAAAALAQDLKPYGVSVITLHPGAVSLAQLSFRIAPVQANCEKYGGYGLVLAAMPRGEGRCRLLPCQQSKSVRCLVQVQTDMYEAFHAGQRQLQQMCNGQHGSGLTERNRDSQTDQGHGRPKPLTVSESVAGMLQCIDSLTLDESGCFCSWTGETLD